MRLLLHTPLDMPDFVFEGLPCYYDSSGFYTGPLPSAQGYTSMLQRQAKGAFKTTGSEQWPAKMCQWLSALLLSSCLHSANAAYSWHQSNEALLKKAMTTKFPSTLILMELAEELSAKNCELQLQWIRRDLNQLARRPHQRELR